MQGATVAGQFSAIAWHSGITWSRWPGRNSPRDGPDYLLTQVYPCDLPLTPSGGEDNNAGATTPEQVRAGSPLLREEDGGSTLSRKSTNAALCALCGGAQLMDVMMSSRGGATRAHSFHGARRDSLYRPVIVEASLRGDHPTRSDCTGGTAHTAMLAAKSRDREDTPRGERESGTCYCQELGVSLGGEPRMGFQYALGSDLSRRFAVVRLDPGGAALEPPDLGRRAPDIPFPDHHELTCSYDAGRGSAHLDENAEWLDPAERIGARSGGAPLAFDLTSIALVWFYRKTRAGTLAPMLLGGLLWQVPPVRGYTLRDLGNYLWKPALEELGIGADEPALERHNRTLPNESPNSTELENASCLASDSNGTCPAGGDVNGTPLAESGARGTGFWSSFGFSPYE